MRVLSLFSGGGLGDYGLTLAGMEIVGQVEIDDYCQKILKLRWPDVPKWRDIRDVKGSEVLERCGRIDLISGGFPCQDISYANAKAEGISGRRSGLWSEMFRIVCEIRPKYVLVENVSALLERGIGVVLGDLASIGFDAEWDCVRSSSLGNVHRRERVFILAYPHSEGLQRRQIISQDKEMHSRFMERFGREKQLEGLVQSTLRIAIPTRTGSGVHDGITQRVDKLRMCGNGQDVRVIRWIGKRIMEFANTTNKGE
jgi:DNA (cytosine-5)-methyltransferase 1